MEEIENTKRHAPQMTFKAFVSLAVVVAVGLTLSFRHGIHTRHLFHEALRIWLAGAVLAP